MLLSNGERREVEAVRSIRYEEAQTTYNFEVEDFHTYYVGTGALVHNLDCNVNQMNAQIKKGQRLKVLNAYFPKVKGEQIHVHLNKGSATNIDGTLKHGNGKELIKAIATWLKRNGWEL